MLADAARSLVRLGRFGSVMEFIQEAMKYPVFFTGFSLCELLVLFVSSFPVASQLDMLERVTALAIKHSPLWSLCLDLQEHITLLLCPLHNIFALPADPQYDALCSHAISTLSNDSVWKVFQIRVLKSSRLLTLLCIVDFTMWNAPDPTRCSHAMAEEMTSLVAAARSAIITCPTSLRWKVFLTLGRAAAMTGQPMHARAVGAECLSEA